jgi:Flp pilus assembly protein TadG
MQTKPSAECRAPGFLKTLKRAEAGNVLPMMAMALVPIAGMVGSGLDMSRAYMTKAKLQTACDSAALAARRYMAGNPFSRDADANGEPDAKTEGKKFFAFNFPEGTMGTAPVTPSITATGDVVTITASTAVPTTIMKMFGKNEIELSTTCDADQDYVNNDIMLVLDVTGSMNCTAGTDCDYQATEQSNSRISKLRSAAGALYRALSDADAGVRIRYGFMPYSMTVNVGKDLNTGWVRTTSPYMVQNADGSFSYQNVAHDGTWMSNWRSTASAHADKGCVEERSTISTNVDSNTIRISSDVAQADLDTVSTIDDRRKWHPYDPGANRREEFRPPYLSQADFDRFFPNNLRSFCPAPARRLATYATEAAFNTELNRAVSRVGGMTNHDLGMMWAARYMSGATGAMFAADNPDVLNAMRVDRHIVFLTDGEMTSYGFNYSAYGMPDYQNRWNTSGVTPEQLVAKHQARFLNACNRARQMGPNGTTVWVIALDVGSTSSISPCASGSDRFFISNGTDLESVFDTIGKEIGKLRLTR